MIYHQPINTQVFFNNACFACMVTGLQISANISVFSEKDVSCGIYLTVKVEHKYSYINKGRKVWLQ